MSDPQADHVHMVLYVVTIIGIALFIWHCAVSDNNKK